MWARHSTLILIEVGLRCILQAIQFNSGLRAEQDIPGGPRLGDHDSPAAPPPARINKQQTTTTSPSQPTTNSQSVSRKHCRNLQTSYLQRQSLIHLRRLISDTTSQTAPTAQVSRRIAARHNGRRAHADGHSPTRTTDYRNITERVITILNNTSTTATNENTPPTLSHSISRHRKPPRNFSLALPRASPSDPPNTRNPRHAPQRTAICKSDSRLARE